MRNALNIRNHVHGPHSFRLHRSTKMTSSQPNNPLHGITLEMIVTQLVEKYGWTELGKRIPIKCFTDNPSIKSSLKFLRRTP